jgi:hypothetical protein
MLEYLDRTKWNAIDPEASPRQLTPDPNSQIPINERVRAGIVRAQREGTKNGKAFGRPKISAEREAAVRASLAAGNGIVKTARLVGTGNATVAAIKAGM